MMQPARRRARVCGARRALTAFLSLSAFLLAPSGPSRAGCPTLSGTTGLVRVRDAKLQTRGVLALSLAGHYYESLDLSESLGTEEAGRYVSLHLDASLGVTDWLEMGADVPFRRASWTGSEGGDVSGEVLDSPSLSARVPVPLGSLRHLLSVEGRAFVPLEDELTVSGPDGEECYVTGGGTTRWDVALLATADLSPRVPLRLHANVGWAFRGGDARRRRFFPDSYSPAPAGASSADNDALVLRAAVEFPGRSVDLFTEFVGDMTRAPELVAPKENAFSLMPGVRVRFAGDWSLTAGFTVALSGDDRDTPAFDPHVAYPDWEATVVVGRAWPVFAADSDGDGIADFRDRCRRAAEDADGYQDGDGCPDEDNDGDGIPDAVDVAPLQAEDADGFEDADGAPDLDNDGDGIVDERDMCPDRAEDLNGVEDGDGCPDQ